MKQFQILIENEVSAEEKINELKSECDTFNHGVITFYITWMSESKEAVDFIMTLIEKKFPDALCYGNEAAGNIHNGSIKYGINITCYVFENKSTKAQIAWVENDAELQSLEDLWAYCKNIDGLCAVELIPTITFYRVLGIEGNVADLDENVHVFGGVACNYYNPEIPSEIIATGHNKTSNGMVAVLYSGNEVTFTTKTVLGWKPLGKKLEVTKSDNNAILEFNNRPAFEIYERYLGLTVEDNDALIFPLIVTEDDHDFIRTPMIINPDKSMVMYANIPVGTPCKVSYGDKNLILASVAETANTISSLKPEAIKAFSCCGRRLFWNDNEVSAETEILQGIVPVSGFYTGGEIVRYGKKIRVLNQTLALTIISENRAVQNETPVIFDKFDKSLAARLAHFTEAVLEEQNQEQRKLKQDMEIISSLASEYTTLFLLNLDDSTFVNYATSERSADIRAALAKINNYKELGMGFVKSGAVHPDYVDEFIDFFVNEKIKIRHKKSYTMLFKRKFGDDYLWTRAKAVKCEDTDEEPHNVVLGFIECDDEVRKEQSIRQFASILGREQSPDLSIKEALKELAEYYAAERTFVLEYRSNTKDFELTNEYLKDGAKSFKTIYEEAPDEDKKSMLTALQSQELIYEEHNGLIQVGYPIKNNDEFCGYIFIVNAKRFQDDKSIGDIAFSLIVSQIARRKEHDEEHVTLGKLIDTFVSVYYVDLNKDYMRAWKESREGNISGTYVRKYTEAIAAYAEKYVIESDRESHSKILNPKNIIEEFKTKDHFALDITEVNEGKERNLLYDFIRIKDDGTQFVISCSDVTDSVATQKKHQQQLQKALEMAKYADKAKTEFLFNMSHDIRTPMNAILGFTDMAIRHFDDKERAMDSLSKIKSSGNHLLNLINDILEMSRIESGKFELGESPIDIREAIANVANMTQSLATPKSIDYKVIPGEFKNPYIYADELHTNEVIVNLISNAIKYTNEDGKVRYTINQISDVQDGKVWYRFDISDNGIGMSEEFQKHLFEAFSREKSSTVSKIQGAGLGLSIVKRIVDLAGGKIIVNSKLGEGSSFIVDIPFRVMDQDAINKLIPEQKMKNDANINEDVVLEGKKVLLVEDNEMNREIADEILTEVGLNVETAENGQIAVDMVAEKGIGYYDFILMDIQMPVLDGYGATAEIRKLPDGNRVPIIALSANAFEEDKKKSVSMGMNAHVAKPINVKELFEAMHNLT